MEENRKVLIAGCGYVGEALGARLARRGDAVVGWRRTPSSCPSTFPVVARDLMQPASYGDLDHDHVVFCSAPSKGTARDEGVYRATYVDSLRCLIDELDRRDAAPANFVFVSSTAVYGDRAGEWVDEASPVQPEAYRGEVMLAAEELVRSAPFPTVIVRFGGIYGPGRTRWIESVRSGRARPRSAHWTNRIHREDCAGLLEHVLDAEAPELVMGVDRRPTTELEFAVGLAELLGVPAPQAVSEEPATGRRCRSRVLDALGYQLRHPSWREGYGAILDGSSEERP